MENVPVATDAVMTGECVELKKKKMHACILNFLVAGTQKK